MLDTLLLLALRQQAAQVFLEALHLLLRGLQPAPQLFPGCFRTGSCLAGCLALHAFQICLALRCC